MVYRTRSGRKLFVIAIVVLGKSIRIKVVSEPE